MKLAMEVYNTGNTLSESQKEIAYFWDDNPFVTNVVGHAMFANKKMTPAGHWLAIIRTVSQDKKLDLMKCNEAYTLGSLALFDGFVSCWDEKYRSNRIRPETYINRYINIKWQPVLQTPPFPEYTSGHSVVSTAAAEVLTYLLGDRFAYTDNSEEMFEIPARSFSSFRNAAAEAAISRMYGGIHYRDAIENGQQQGKELGAFITNKLQAAGIKPVK
jgi:hypothetical protein